MTLFPDVSARLDSPRAWASLCCVRVTNLNLTQPSDTSMWPAGTSKSCHSTSPSRKVTSALTWPPPSGATALTSHLRAGATPSALTVPTSQTPTSNSAAKKHPTCSSGPMNHSSLHLSCVLRGLSCSIAGSVTICSFFGVITRAGFICSWSSCGRSTIFTTSRSDDVRPLKLNCKQKQSQNNQRVETVSIITKALTCVFLSPSPCGKSSTFTVPSSLAPSAVNCCCSR
jgi:hypothetical protein